MRVTGLDPAGPLFTTPLIVSADNRLASTDANFVQAIHTNANAFGAWAMQIFGLTAEYCSRSV